MNILIATGLYAPDIGGPATYTAFLEKHLPALGYAYTVVPFASVRKYPKIVRHIAYTAKLIRASQHTDIIYALDTVSVGVPALIASLITRRRLMLRVPGDYAWEQGQARFGLTETLDEYLVSTVRPWRVRILARFQSWVARHAVCVIVPSEYLRTVVTRWGVNPEKIERVYSALKVIDVAETREQVRNTFGLSGFVIVTAARLVPWKGVGGVIDALALLRDAGVPATLYIIGDGPLRGVLTALAEEQGVAPFVHFTGSIDRATLGRYLKASDVCVLNTAYEGLSHQLLEAMHLGVPVITTPVGGNLELIHDGENGIFVPQNDTHALASMLKKLFEQPETRASLATHAAAQVASFHEDEVIKEFTRVIRTRIP